MSETKSHCAKIHPTAVIAPDAVIGEGTSIGPFSVVGAGVIIGKNNKIGSHTVIEGRTTIGDENQIFQFASVGAEPQDLKYSGEESVLKIGDKNIVREYVTLQPGTSGGGMETVIGDANLFMACSHVGHDSIVGNHNIFANSAALSGHVTIGNWVTMGGLSGAHQFIRIGDHAFLGGGTMVSKDVPPYCLAQGDRAYLFGLNVVGMKRRGFDVTDISILRKLYRDLFLGKGKMADRLELLCEEHSNNKAASFLLDFVKASDRGVVFPRSKGESTSQE
jgi:UDP-N-acetylglucosamine acyltransferase